MKQTDTSLRSNPTVDAAGQPPLRVLHLEDDVRDRELVGEVLSARFSCEFTYAQDEAEFTHALAQAHFDLILSDFTLPGYGGESALALAQKRQPEVPYLFVSGTIGEERAIDNLKNGATDHVLKNHLERLLPAVDRALREAREHSKRREAEEALREALDRKA